MNKEKKDWLTVIHLPKRASYLNPNERKVNNKKRKSDVCANRFNTSIEQKYIISEYLDKGFGDVSRTLMVTLDLRYTVKD